jgi:diguanylate cyclase (GGDEF)-like protein
MSVLAKLKLPTIRDRRSHVHFIVWVAVVAIGVALAVDVANQLIFFVDWTTCLRSWAITVFISGSLAITIAYLIGAAQLELFRAKQLADTLSHTDSLTGLANRRALIESAEASLPEVLALAIFDIDRFKAVNDTYGHLAGDAVLRAVSRMMAEELSGLGRVARVGGEEFAVLSWGVSAETLVTRLIGFRDRLRVTPILVGDLTLRVTMSAGVALCQGCENFDRLYSHADRALYEAKAAGRNRFQFPPTLEPLVNTTVTPFAPPWRATGSRSA